MINQVSGLLTLFALPLALLLSGYWLAAPLHRESPLCRLCVATAAGLGILMVGLGTLAFFHPISAPWSALCLASALPALVAGNIRRGLTRDLAGSLRSCPPLLWVAGLVFLAILLWPLLSDPGALYFDGSPNHDAFFWTARADYLLRHGFMEHFGVSPTRPFENLGGAIVGWTPVNGRIGAEGLLALAASITGKTPISLYPYVSASLTISWWAVCLLALRTFISQTISFVTGVVLIALEPVFIFFHANANLPNLLGVLTGTTMIVATEMALRSESDDTREFRAWSAIAGISLGGMLCAYPEIAPFALLPCGLLLARSWFRRSRRSCALAGLALFAGAAINPATTIRAFNGFLASFELARASDNWFDLFSLLNPAEAIPAAVTLSFTGAKELGWVAGGFLSAMILVLIGLVIRHARDRFGTIASLSAVVLLLGYSLVADFSYGFQKTVQFSGVMLAVVFPSGAVEMVNRMRLGESRRPRLAATLLTVAIAFCAYSSAMTVLDIYKWSHRKRISVDWFNLRDASSSILRDKPVLVDASTFRYDFFDGMWAAYFLQGSHIYYGRRDEHPGGYMENDTISERDHEIPSPAAILVGRDWADSLDSNSPRKLSGREYALLQSSNRVLRTSGLSPSTGVPEFAAAAFSLEVLPHSTSTFLFDIEPRERRGVQLDWLVVRRAGSAAEFTTNVSGAFPWSVEVPLVEGEVNMITVSLGDRHVHPGGFPFKLSRLRIVDAR